MNEVAAGIEEQLPYLRRYAMALTHNPAAADDLVQECAARSLAKSHLYRANTNLRAWLLTILHNLHISEYRRQSRMPVPADPEAALAKLSVRPGQPAAMMIRAVREAMKVLPAEQAAVLMMIGVEGRSYKEVAEQLGLPIGTVKTRCFRARTALQHALGDDRPAMLPAAA
jgi:RNA polymerase sigma-70 factor (ECF subfamily)